MTLPLDVLELEVLSLPTAKRDAEIERGESTPVSGPEAVARLRLDHA